MPMRYHGHQLAMIRIFCSPCSEYGFNNNTSHLRSELYHDQQTQFQTMKAFDNSTNPNQWITASTCKSTATSKSEHNTPN